jgi:ATP-dependent helicase/nuclease subunit B
LLRLASERTQYAIDLDYYETALRVSTDQVTVVHNYKDSGGNNVQWSSFVDLLPVEDNEEVIRADEWLPEPSTETPDGWAELSGQLAEKDRIRLLTHHSERDYPTQRRPSITAEAIQRIAGQCDAETFEIDIMSRHRRYFDPPTEITVDPDESAFDEVAFENIVGEPIRTHELDLYSQCQLKYYFYMLLFNYNGRSVERERIPFHSSRRPHRRFGWLPHVIRDQRISTGRREKLEYLIEDEFDDRYELTDRFDSREEIEEWLEEADEFSEYDLDPLVPLIQNEWQLVQQEEAANRSGQRSAPINREWTWRDWETVEISGTEVRFEPHRRDIIHNDDGYQLPVFHARHPSYAEKALKNCWESDNHQYRQPEVCEGICSRCDNLDDCSVPTKYTLDHRLHTAELTIESLSGVVMAEQYQRGSDGRDGLIKAHHLDELRDGIEGGPESILDEYNRRLPNRGWRGRASGWEEDMSEHLAEMTGDEMTSFSVDDQFVADGACEECVYREMCFVPQSSDRL